MHTVSAIRSEANDRILFVDDDAQLRKYYELQFGRRFRVDTSASGAEAIERLVQEGPYALVAADMHMDGMSGAELLERIREISPDTVRIMVTGDERQETAVAAVNGGQVFRFVNKSASPEVVSEALQAGLDEHARRLAERGLLADTYHASVQLLMQCLSEVNRAASARGARVRRIVERLCDALQAPDAWEIVAAAQLSQIGCITLREEVVQKVQRAAVLTEDEVKLYRAHPERGKAFVAAIPRLERVAEIIARQEAEACMPLPPTNRGSITWRARLLKVAIDYDALVQRGWLPRQALTELASTCGYDLAILGALEEMIEQDLTRDMQLLRARELEEGMRLIDDIVDHDGFVLVTSGQTLQPRMLAGLQRQIESGRSVREPIRVLPRLEDAEQRDHEVEEEMWSIPLPPPHATRRCEVVG